MPQITVTLKNDLVLPTFNALRDISGAKTSGKIAWKLARILRDVRACAAPLEETLNSLLNKYTEKDAEGKPTPVVDDDGKVNPNKIKLTDVAAYKAESAELLEQTSEITTYSLTEADVESIDGAPIQALELLIPFVDPMPSGPKAVK